MELANRVRWFCCTDWNLNNREDYEKIVQKGQIRFIAWGRETCPKTKKLHNQMFFYFHNPKTWSGSNLKKIGNMFGPIHCHVSPKRGSVPANEAYCAKESTLEKVGEEPKAGMRGDIDEAVKKIIDGDLTPDDICEENPLFYHQYGRTFEKAQAIGLRRKWRTWMTEGVWYTGPSGSGKSHECFKDFDPKTHYIKNLNEDWWDGYMGQEIVILNEFRGSIKFSELLDLVDKYPKTVKWRNRESVPFLAKKVIITSIKHPKECYENVVDEPWSQFNRRFKIIKLKARSPLDSYAVNDGKKCTEVLNR